MIEAVCNRIARQAVYFCLIKIVLYLSLISNHWFRNEYGLTDEMFQSTQDIGIIKTEPTRDEGDEPMEMGDLEEAEPEREKKPLKHRGLNK